MPPRVDKSRPGGVRRYSWAVAAVALGVAAMMVQPSSAAFTAGVTNNANTASTANYFTCEGAILGNAPTPTDLYFAYRLDEVSTSTSAADFSGVPTVPGTYVGGMVSDRTPQARPGSCPRDPVGAYQTNGSSRYLVYDQSVTVGNDFTVGIWFRTSAKKGKLIGFADTNAVNETKVDRHLYVNSSGHVVFGVNVSAPPGTFPNREISDSSNYADGLWHHAAGTLSGTDGMTLYVDGNVVATNSTARTNPGLSQGYWKVGFGRNSNSAMNVSRNYFSGWLRYAAAYKVALSAAQVKQLYDAGR